MAYLSFCKVKAIEKYRHSKLSQHNFFFDVIDTNFIIEKKAMKSSRRVIVWFRQDLRLHDNEVLVEAMKRGDEVVPIYVFDERQFLGKTKYGFNKTGKYRAKFIIECVEDLRQSFRDLGIDLIVRE